jgi:disulfide bond formation protein DsbB
MKIRFLRFVTLLLAALGLIMGGAHVLELVPKLHYDARLYEQVTSTMYRYFGIAGGIIQVLAILFAAILAVAVRARPGFRWTLAGAVCLAVSLGLWFALVQPVNRQWAGHSPD